MKKIWMLFSVILCFSFFPGQEFTVFGLEKAPEEKFSSSHWAYEWVEKAIVLDLLAGEDLEDFEPSSFMSRGLFTQGLYKVSGVDFKSRETPFADVPPEYEYATAIAWAYETGIVSGMAEDIFAPLDHITREQMAAEIKLYLDYLQIDGSSYPAAAHFNDMALVRDYAKEAVVLCRRLDILTGMGNNNFAPAGTFTKAQGAVVLVKLWYITNEMPEDIDKTLEKYYTVSFVTGGGSSVGDREVKEGTLLTKPNDPTKGGHHFYNWYTDPDFKTLYNFNIPVTESFTLYAKWRVSSAGGGSGRNPVTPGTNLNMTGMYHSLDGEYMTFYFDQHLTTGSYIETIPGKKYYPDALAPGAIVIDLKDYTTSGPKEVDFANVFDEEGGSPCVTPRATIIKGLYILDSLERLTAFHDAVITPEAAIDTYRLTADFDLTQENLNGTGPGNWRPKTLEAGVLFDGNGHTIKGITIKELDDHHNAGFFGTVLNGAKIEHFTLEDISIDTRVLTVSATGGLVGHLAGGIVTDTSISGKISIESNENKVGGMIGFAEDAALKNLSLVTTSASSITTSGNYIGGIVGYLDNSSITNSEVTVQMVLEIEGSSFVGGIVGNLNGNCSLNELHFISKTPQTKITAADPNDGSVGGIAGIVNNGSSLSNCSFDGNYCVISGGEVVGGIAGSVLSSNSNTSDITFKNNTVTRVELISNASTGMVGGIAGWLGSSFRDRTIEQCSVVDVSIKGRWGGGIAGELSGDNDYISNCYTAYVTFDCTVAGGIAGYNYGSIYDSHAYHPFLEGKTDANTGLIAGRSTYIIENCGALSENPSDRVSGTGGGTLLNNHVFSTGEMVDMDNFNGYNGMLDWNTSVWRMGNDYPVFR